MSEGTADLGVLGMDKMGARFEASPCLDWLGRDGADHFVKTVHNGIEYADMQPLEARYHKPDAGPTRFVRRPHLPTRRPRGCRWPQA